MPQYLCILNMSICKYIHWYEGHLLSVLLEYNALLCSTCKTIYLSSHFSLRINAKY